MKKSTMCARYVNGRRLPKAFAYKILRELEMGGLIKSERGNRGGYYLAKSLDELTIYDIISITEG